MVTTGFQETSQKKVSLSEEDDPDTFAVIRDFLYCKRISLRNRTLVQMLSVIRSAHRWELLDLFEVILRHICIFELLTTATSVLTMVDAVRLPGIPKEFKDYFWRCAGLFFDGFSPQDVRVRGDASQQVANGGRSDGDFDDEEDDWTSSEDVDEGSEGAPEDIERDADDGREDESIDGEQEGSPADETNNGNVADGGRSSGDQMETVSDELPGIEKRLCPFFPGIWELAISQGMITNLIRDIVWSSSRNENTLKADLMQLVLHYVEPRVSDDATVAAMMTVLFSDFMQNEHYLSRWEFQQGCSMRAFRLFSKALITSTRAPRPEMTYCWRVPYPSRNGIVRASYDFSYGMRGGSEPDPTYVRSIDSVSQSLHFNVKIKTHPRRAIEFIVRWEPGSTFPLLSQDLVLRVVLIDDNCNCGGDRRASGEYLVDDSVQHSLGGSKTRFSAIVDEVLMQQYYSRHSVPRDDDVVTPCVPSLWLQVRLVNP